MKETEVVINQKHKQLIQVTTLLDKHTRDYQLAWRGHQTNPATRLDHRLANLAITRVTEDGTTFRLRIGSLLNGLTICSKALNYDLQEYDERGER